MQARSAKKTAETNEDESFDQVFLHEIQTYGGFHHSVARKTNKDGAAGKSLEKKTERLVKLCKQVRDGDIDFDDEEELPAEGGKEDTSLPQTSVSPKRPDPEGKKWPEERSDSLQYLKNSFQHYMERQFNDKANEGQQRDALFDTVTGF